MIVELCEHGEAKPHGGFDDDGAIWEPCPGGRVLNQAIIIERDTDGQWPRQAILTIYNAVLAHYEPSRFLDALASAQDQP